MGLVQPAAFEIVADLPSHGAAECELRRLVEGAVEGMAVGQGLGRNRLHHRLELAAQFIEQGADRHGGHALVGDVDQGISDVRIGREEAGIFAGKLYGLFQEGRHGREVIGRPRPRPGIVGCEAGRAGARDIVGRHLDRLFEVPFRHPDQACGVGLVGQGRGIGGERIDEFAERGIDGLLVREPAQRCALPCPRRRAAGRHVGRLVPDEHGTRRAEIADLGEPVPELFELRFLRPHHQCRPCRERLTSVLKHTGSR